jgi:hypothetical protein
LQRTIPQPLQEYVADQSADDCNCEILARKDVVSNAISIVLRSCAQATDGGYIASRYMKLLPRLMVGRQKPRWTEGVGEQSIPAALQRVVGSTCQNVYSTRRNPEMRKSPFGLVSLFLLAASALCATPSFGRSTEETGKLKIHVNPKQAYVFVDGKAIRDGSQTIELPAGDHKVGVYNYGYLPKIQDVRVGAGETTDLDVMLQSSGGRVPGPFADIEFKGYPRAAVLLNGQTPAYFVGHVDEFDWDWIWHQRLLVKPGAYHVTVTREGNTIWSSDVTAKAAQKIIIHLDKNGEMTTKDWQEGGRLGPQPRFRVGIASATIPIAPVTAKLTAQSTSLGCGQSTALTWNTADAVDTSISNLGPVPLQGDRTIKPMRNTTYVLTAKGPGGEATLSATVDVKTQPNVTIALSQPEVRYHKIGDKVVEQGSATLNWSASNAASVRIEPFGSEATSGSRTVEANPRQTATGALNDDVTYTLIASNTCGGTATKTATLHVVGSIDPPPPVTLASIFYPTAYPTKKYPKVGLVASEKKVLMELAVNFQNHDQYEQKDTLVIVGHADVRGSVEYNQALSLRRAILVRNFLVSRGVPAEKIQTRAEGKTHQLHMKKVETLQSQDNEKPEKWMLHHKRTTWLAYNRRADIILEPEAESSKEVYPNEVADAHILWQRPLPSLTKVEAAGKMPSASASYPASAGGN